MSDEESDCGIQVGQLQKILGEKKAKLTRDLEFERKFQEKYGMNESRTVDAIQDELTAVGQLEKDVCNEDWCKKVKAAQQKPVTEPLPVTENEEEG